MAQILPEKPKKVSYSWFGCFSILVVLTILVLAVFVLPSIKEARIKTQLNDAKEAIKQTPPSASLSNEDTVVLTVWMYFEVKMGQDVDDYNASKDNTTDRANALENLNSLITIEHSLPTNEKYRPLIDSLAALAHERVNLILKDKGSDTMGDQAMLSSATDNMKKFAPDIRYVTDVLPEEERNRILNRYYGNL